MEKKKSVLKSFRNNFWIFSLSYFSMLIVVVLICSYSYYNVFNIVKDNVVYNTKNSLRQSVEIYDKNFLDVKNTITRLSNDPDIRYFSNKVQPFGDLDYAKMYNINIRNNLVISNNFLLYIITVYPSNGLIIAPGLITARADKTYGSLMKYNNINFEKFKNRLREISNNKIWGSSRFTLYGKQYDVITYVEKIGINFGINNPFYICAMFDEGAMKKIIDAGADDVSYFIGDKDGNIVTTINSTFKFDRSILKIQGKDLYNIYDKKGKQYILFVFTSVSSGLKFFSAVPVSSILLKVERVKNIIISSILIMLCVGILIAFILAYVNNLPIRRIIRKINSLKEITSDNSKSEYEKLSKTIDYLCDSNQQLRDLIVKQMEFKKVALLERLLRNGFSSSVELEESLKSVDIDISNNKVSVAIINVGNLQVEIVITLLIDFLKEYRLKNIYCHITDGKATLIIFSGESNKELQQQVTLKFLENITDYMEKKYAIHINSGLGRPHNHLNAGDSFNEAILALYYACLKQIGIARFDLLPSDFGKYYYPMDVEFKIISLAKTGKYYEISIILNEIFYKNFIEKYLSEHSFNSLKNELCSTVDKVRFIVLKDNDDIWLYEQLNKSRKENMPDLLFELIGKSYEYICQKVEEKKRSHNLELYKQIIDYIKMNYTDPNLCLAVVADRLKVTQGYISQFMQEQHGRTFTLFIEELRMQHAIQLLKEKDISIKEIYSVIGYANINTFFKAFKRIYNMSPNQYRLSILNE